MPYDWSLEFNLIINIIRSSWFIIYFNLISCPEFKWFCVLSNKFITFLIFHYYCFHYCSINLRSSIVFHSCCGNISFSSKFATVSELVKFLTFLKFMFLNGEVLDTFVILHAILLPLHQQLLLILLNCSFLL